MSGSPPPDRDRRSAESVFDAYLEAALQGVAREPEAFLADFPELTDAERADLAKRFAAIGALATPKPRDLPVADDHLNDVGRLGEFRLLRRLGGGAMGDVYLAEQVSLGRLVALKTQRADLVGSPRATARFEREAQALAQVTHPSVVGVHGFGRADQDAGADLRYLAMELVPGRSLKELLDEPRPGESPPSPVQVARWGVELAQGLAAVHAAGLLHRDVKPSNVRIREDGRAVLVDFGLARSTTESELSRTGEFIGSPAYAAPEQVQGVADLDARADVYGLGATLYHALAGRPPFTGASIDAVLHAVLHRDPAPLRSANPNLPRDLELVTAKAMEKARDQRYASADAFGADLLAVLELRPVLAKPVGLGGRALRWSRRNRLAAASLVLALATVLIALVGVGWKAHVDHRAQLDRAAGHVAQARATIAEYASERRALLAEEADYDQLYKLQEYQHLTSAEIDRMRELEARVRAARERRDDAYRAVGNLLDQAVALDPSLSAEVNAVWSALLVERIVEAEDRGDVATRDVFIDEIERRDPDGSFRAATYPFARMRFACPAPGARAWLMRLVALDALGASDPHAPSAVIHEAREVPVPLGAGEFASSASYGFAPPVAWGEQVLRVTRGAGVLAEGDLVLDVAGQRVAGGPIVTRAEPALGLEVGDRLLRVNDLELRDRWDLDITLLHVAGTPVELVFATADGERRVPMEGGEEWELGLADVVDWAATGGLPARVYSGGSVRQVTLPAGIELRPTAAPLFLDPAWSMPLDAEVDVAPGRYLFVVQAPGRVVQRAYIEARKETREVVTLDPPAHDFAPPGFVPIWSVNDNQLPFFMAESEVTSAEYLAYLNDPAVRAEIDAARAAGVAMLYPRSSFDDGDWGMWERAEGGPFALADDWPTDWPVLGISWDDAVAYCAWRTAHDPRGGRFRLPHPNEFYIAGSGAYARKFSWGDHFDQRFANTCFTRRLARPAPVRTHPHDESPFGLYDMSGNAAEWLDTWWDASRELRPAASGAWGQARIEDLGIIGQRGLAADTAWGESGMRLVWEPGETDGPR